MKALSIKQPWASLIAHGIKDIENRTWKTHFRGRIYIHASAKPAGSTLDLLTVNQLNSIDKVMKYSFSAIIGEVEIVDCVINHPSIWAEKIQTIYSKPSIKDKNLRGYEEALKMYQENKPIYNWVLANPILYDKPILNVKGKLSFWETDYIHCENCNKPYHCNQMVSNDEAQWFCNSCVKEGAVEFYNFL